MIWGLCNSRADNKPTIMFGLKPEDVALIQEGKIINYELASLNKFREEGEPELPDYRIVLFLAAGENLEDIEIDMLETKFKKELGE